MNVARVLSVVILSATICACSSSDGGDSSGSANPGWEKFRHDSSNTGRGNGSVAANNGRKLSVQIDASAPLGAISSSPAVSGDGSAVYIASEGGTVARLARTLGTPVWRVNSCGACPPGKQALGPMVSSPAIYTLTNQPHEDLNGQTTIYVGSTNGSVYGFQDSGSGPPSCIACFQPDFGTGARVQFISSASLTVDPVRATVFGVFLGARIDLPDNRTIGKLYALNSNGTENWEYPRVGAPEIGAVTSSPARAVLTTGGGNETTWYFTAADNYMYAVDGNGTLKWKARIGDVTDSSVPFGLSPVTSAAAIFASSAGGNIVALNQDGSPLWLVSAGAGRFAGSLAIGGIPLGTPTPSPAATPAVTPTPAGGQAFVYGVTKSGSLLVVDVAVPTPTVLPSLPTPVSGQVLSSPSLSSDSYLVFGTDDGTLHAVSAVTGLEPAGWPVVLNPGTTIRSSPTIADDGIIYVGADDGMLYAVGLP
ncbi:MAG: cell surface protein [Deltaproteobacteria bacterium]|nr:cell surface protein [Deltaproteobacteria bacterium]